MASSRPGSPPQPGNGLPNPEVQSRIGIDFLGKEHVAGHQSICVAPLVTGYDLCASCGQSGADYSPRPIALYPVDHPAKFIRIVCGKLTAAGGENTSSDPRLPWLRSFRQRSALPTPCTRHG